MNTQEWLSMLNSLSEEELESIFIGMAVKLLVKDGKIVKVINHAF